MLGCMFSGLDSSGFFGQLLHYLILFMMFGMTLLIFIYLWRQKKLDMDEAAKYQMMEDDDERR